MDAVMLERVLAHIHNWFERSTLTVRGCEITGGELPASVTDELPDGLWYRVQGSLLNDGLHLSPDTDLSDETFDGTITLLAIPRPLLSLCEEISDWQDAASTATSKVVESPYQSESFGGYSYSLRGDLFGGSQGGLTGWQARFASELNAWRKMY